MTPRGGVLPPARGALLLARLGGTLLTGVVVLIGHARRNHAKSLHPRGVVTPGVLRRTGTTAAAATDSSGVAWLDEPGSEPVTVRLSRGAGLPAGLPDVLGLAFRLPTSSGSCGDVLLASAGTSPLGRFVLHPGRHAEHASYCTLMPYRTPSGPVVLGASPDQRGRYALAWARPLGAWHRFATLELPAGPGLDLAGADPLGADADVSFDAVLNVPPGLETYAWTAALRERAYAVSRRLRDGRQNGADA